MWFTCHCKMRQRTCLPWLLIFSLVALPLPLPLPLRVCILVGTTGEPEMDKQIEITLKYFLSTKHPTPQPPNLPHDVSYQLDSLSPRAQINSISWKNIKWRVSYQPGVTSLSEEIKTFQISNSLFTEFHSALTSSHLVRPAPSWPERGRLGWGVGWGGTC